MSYFAYEKGSLRYIPETNQKTTRESKELTPYGTWRDIVDSNPELIGYDRYSYGSESRPLSISEQLHGGGGNKYAEQMGTELQQQRERGRYQRNNEFIESIIPEIKGRSNIIPKIKKSIAEIENRKSERRALLNDIEQKIPSAQKAITDAEAIETKTPLKTYGYSWAPYGLYNNEYYYERTAKNIKIEKARADLKDLENQKKNYEEDLIQSDNLKNLLKEYEKEKRFEFLNEYESRTDSGNFGFGGPIAPALTPTGSPRYKSRGSSGYKAVTFDVPQTPFEGKPITGMPKTRTRYRDPIMENFTKSQDIPFNTNFGKEFGSINKKWKMKEKKI